MHIRRLQFFLKEKRKNPYIALIELDKALLDVYVRLFLYYCLISM